jgi:hypothetical protein
VQVFAGFEANGFARGDANFGSGTRIAANACFAGPDVEDPKAAQLNAVAVGEGLLEALKDGLDGGLGFYAGQSGTLNYLMYDVLLNQWLSPETRARNAASAVLCRC